MSLKTTELPTIPESLHHKAIRLQDNPNLKQEVRDYFIQTYNLYEKLFDLMACEEAYYIRSETLRHPLIFYYGHTAAVYINKLYEYGIIYSRVNPCFQKILAVGVDQMDWDDLDQTLYEWPSLEKVKEYRLQVREVVLAAIDKIESVKMDNWHNELWVVMIGIEHERVHTETSAVIMRRLPLEMVKPVQGFVQCPSRQQALEKIPNNQMKIVQPWKGFWEYQLKEPETFGIDNEFGQKEFDVPEFKTSQMLVSNGEYLKFVEDGGYNHPEWWTQEGQAWISSIKPQMPLFWRKQGDSYRLRTLFQEINMPWNWPVQVNNIEARAFCKWRTEKTGNYTRLPTEDEYYSLRSIEPKDIHEAAYQQLGNINMQFWMSPNPVNMFKTGDFYDIVGNVWQHTITPIYPFNKFEIHPSYEDYTTPTFDERHDLMKGGSFISTGSEPMKKTRYAFRRHFYQFAGFRYVESEIKMEVDKHCTVNVTDTNVEMNLKHQYLCCDSYVNDVLEKIKEVIGDTKYNKVLTIGCSVGRMPLELGKYFDQSIGIDYTTRYFQMATKVKECGCLKYKDINIDIKCMGVNPEKVRFLQMNPQNPDQKKLNNFDMILIDGYSIRKGSIKEVLSQSLKMTQNKAIIALLNVSGINQIEKEEAKAMIESISGGEVEIIEDNRLQASERDQSYLPERSKQMDFRLNFFRLIK